MKHILCLETATKNCALALVAEGKIVASKSHFEEGYSHAEKLHPLIAALLSENQISPKDIGAIAVSKGPGSYTGLRIGVSAAKGLAFAWDVPLISTSTLRTIATHMRAQYTADIYIPMLDARRQEVYTQSFDKDLQPLGEIEAKVLDENSFENWREKNIVFGGDGAFKIKDIFAIEAGWFVGENIHPDGGGMARDAYSKFLAKDFEDTAYFEPFYLKEFIAGKPKKLL